MEHSEKKEGNCTASSTNSRPPEELMNLFLSEYRKWMLRRLLDSAFMERELYDRNSHSLQLEDEIDQQPTAQHIINNLPNETIQEEVKCPICQKLCSSGEVLKKLPCNHLFDEDCIILWLKRINNCPICRKELETDKEE